MEALKVFTIGHSTRSVEELVEMLAKNGVTELLDVRSLPGSRKFPQWDKENLAPALPEWLDYQWMKKLGGRRYTPVSVQSPNTAWRVKAFRDYADYMATEGFAEGLQELLDIAKTKVPALMCSEAVPWRCHRRLITDALIIRGVKVYDIMSLTSTKEAELNPMAVVDGLQITYPG